MFSDQCQVNGCDKKATRIGSLPESGIIDMCTDCYEKIYKCWSQKKLYLMFLL